MNRTIPRCLTQNNPASLHPRLRRFRWMAALVSGLLSPIAAQAQAGGFVPPPAPPCPACGSGSLPVHPVVEPGVLPLMGLGGGVFWLTQRLQSRRRRHPD